MLRLFSIGESRSLGEAYGAVAGADHGMSLPTSGRIGRFNHSACTERPCVHVKHGEMYSRVLDHSESGLHSL